MYLISACLVGVNCKYNGKNSENKKLMEFVKNNKSILVCPEQLGGLSTPRLPVEIVDRVDDKKIVRDKLGKDVTKEFYKGAEETLKIAKFFDAEVAILKAKSPSCGYGKIYDGSFYGRLIEGKGITAELLEKNGIKIYTEEDIEKLI
ncbi:DUF523 domain-containing protein [Clostridium sp. D2Q-11]|uniref:DUF523 domain-containing protein n=1 Tax=Anaeromonas frigoriresistens TaxID=2683708 RepID=A0A942Z8J4_9FIRM|nr:DUF523 domain-containing protein [Anaeromonas frigoriresistens]MBS4537980.1 DUF523 domain-containing protein [Anaeromonas frigoriresistens]